MTNENLIREYHGAQTQRAKAIFEERLWRAAPPAVRRVTRRALYLKEMLDLPVGANAIEVRGTLLSSGVELLWDRIDAKGSTMPLYTAARMLREARKQVDVPLIEALVALLMEYDARPVAYTSRGKAMRKRPMTRINRQPQSPPRVASTFWSKLRRDIDVFTTARLAGLPAHDIETLARSLEGDLKVLLDEWQSRVHFAKARANGTALEVRVSRRKLADACHAFALVAPRFGDPVDMLEAKKRWRMLAKEYHPDKRGGATVDQFHAVEEAWRVLQTYETQRNKEKTNGLDHRE
jgi:hypothetical protein